MVKHSYQADFLIVGCGLAGATFANLAEENGYRVYIIDRRNHIGGNCHSYIDYETGIEIHKYGPHIFHTSSIEIWNYINRFTKFNNYVNRVKAKSNGCVYSLPINLFTINHFFRKCFNPNEAKKFIEEIRIKNLLSNNFENYVLSSVGPELYEAFFKYYTLKQWGIDPKNIPATTAKRIPLRFNYNDNYYDDIFQGIPIDGYTAIFERMLDKKNIKLFLKTDFSEYKSSWRHKFKYLVYTGSIDEYFDFKYGILPYRTVTFKEIRDKEILGNAVINFTDMSVPYTRIHEHKWFTPEKSFEKSIAFEEYPSFTDSRNEPYYPIRNESSEKLFEQYNLLSKEENDVVFLGRLAEFRYYDMHQVIGSAISKFKRLFSSR